MRVDVCTEEGGGPSRTKGACGDEVGRDAGAVLDQGSGMTEGVGDILSRSICPFLGGWIEVLMNRSVGAGAVTLEASRDPANGLGRAEEGVVGGRMAYFLATNAILLVIEFQVAWVIRWMALESFKGASWPG